MPLWEWTDTPQREWTDSPITQWRPSELVLYIENRGRAYARPSHDVDRLIHLVYHLGLLTGQVRSYDAELRYGRSVVNTPRFRARSRDIRVWAGFSLGLRRFRLRGWAPQPMPPHFIVPRGSARTFRPLILFDGVAVWDTPAGQARVTGRDPGIRIDQLISFERAAEARTLPARYGWGTRPQAGQGQARSFRPQLIPRIITGFYGSAHARGYAPIIGRGVLATRGRAVARGFAPIHKALHIFYVHAHNRGHLRGFRPWHTWRFARDIALQKVYVLILTGSEDGLDDVEIPISSAQLRRRNGRPTVLQATVSDDAWLDAVQARSNGALIFYQGTKLADGSRQLAEITRVDLQDPRHDQGGRSASITLTGRRTMSNNDPVRVELPKVTYRSVREGKRRYRTEVDPWVRPGDTAQVGDEEIEVGYITYSVRTGREQMEVEEA